MAAVREAADLCISVQREMEPGVIQKEDKSPVTIADFGSQALICSRLKAAYPDDPIIAEETASVLREDQDSARRVIRKVKEIRPDAEGEAILDWIDMGGHTSHTPRYWTLDPIDGTKGFMRGDQYAIALALVVEGKVVVAALACPNLSLSTHPDQTGVVAVAEKGGGAELYSLRDMKLIRKARISEATESNRVRVSESVESAHTSHSGSKRVIELMGITAPSTRLDSQAKYVVVAAGDAEIYMRLPTDRRRLENIWDHAAGMLLVEEAGGRVSDINGRDLRFEFGEKLLKNRGVLVSNGFLHDSLLKAITEAEIT